MSATADDPGLEVGSTFCGYTITRRLGAGAFGAVYEAVRQPLNKRVALKVLHGDLTHEPGMLERFLREAQIVAQVEHPNIVSVFDVSAKGAQPYIAMELLEGRSLADRIDHGGTIAIPEAVDTLLPVLSAMATVHERGIVHRDLKPDNIFLARQPTGGVAPKLLDFGIAKVRNAGRALTATRAIMGTPNYMSPEQAQESRSVDGQSDQWALAVILFECLIGRCPIQGESLLAVLTAITSEPAPRLRAYAPAMPEALEAILLRAMEKRPGDRFPSVRDFGAALLPFASPVARAQWEGFFLAAPPRAATGAYEDGGPGAAAPADPARDATVAQGTLTPTTHPSMLGPPQPRRRAVWITAGVALALLAAGSWFALHERAAPAQASLTGHPPAARPVVRPAVPPTPVPAPSPAAPPPAPGVVAAPAAPAPAASPAEDAPQERDGRRRSGRRHRRRGDAPAGGAPQGDFPNI
jgi:hypothetical protein